MTTTADRIRNYELAVQRAAQDRERANHRAATLATENMMLRASLEALYRAVLLDELIPGAVMQQAEAALEWSVVPAQEGAGDAS